MVNVRSCKIPRNVLQADTIVVSCGLANFEQSSLSAHRRHEFWKTHYELTVHEGGPRQICSQFQGQLHPNAQMVVQYGRSIAEIAMIPSTTGG